jgi:pyroglutamyl-peptidase
LQPLLQTGDFDSLLMIGVSGRAQRVHIERRAANRASVLFADASRQRPMRLTLGPGPSHRRSHADAVATAASLRRHALPCALSQNAGRYLCNAAYFRALTVDRPVLFLHIPKKPPIRNGAGTVSRRRLAWTHSVAEAFVDVAIGLLRKARQRRDRGWTRP